MLPVAFWVAMALIVAGVIWALQQMRNGMGLPIIVFLLSTVSWYVVDAFYNNYIVYAVQFTPEVREESWWQVAIFVGAFLILTPMLHRGMNKPLLHRSSQVLQMVREGVDNQQMQAGVQRLFTGCLIAWIALSVVAVIQLQGEVIYYFCPYLSYRADPWSRGRLGSGFDSLRTVAGYVDLLVSMMFGMVVALSKNTKTTMLALLCVALSWPYFILFRARNLILEVVLPGVLAWALLRLRWPLLAKVTVLFFFFLAIYAWFGFVLSNRSDAGIAETFASEGFDPEKSMDVHHAGLNMFEELCWANYFIDSGEWDLHWGTGYLSELVNPIPRSLWPDKPMIGIDYALMRGQGYEDSDQGFGATAGVGATLSTGMIGQGVLDFGQWLGPVFAAFLMSAWTALLIRLDLNARRLGRLELYGLGLILTFNLGRDITLLTLYTFVFGAALVWFLDRQSRARGIIPPGIAAMSPPTGRTLPATSAAPGRPALPNGFLRPGERGAFSGSPARPG